MKEQSPITRRNFIKTSAFVSTAATLASSSSLLAAATGKGKVRIALIGCGSRGTGAAKDCLASMPSVELVAVADLFQDRVDSALADIRAAYGERVKVTSSTTFLGFDAYQKVLAMPEVDIVQLCTPPAFRPLMVRAAIEADKNIFLEKPGAVDSTGVRSLLKSAGLADAKKLSIVVGTQQRWQPQYLEIMKRVHRGDIGDIVGGQAYWNWGHAHWHWEPRKPEWSDLEWQIRCWPYFVWLSGDHIVEQHMHNMDILNWAIGTHPVSCVGFGGRQVRTGPEYGNIFDHFTVEYEYPGNVRVMSMCSQIEGSSSRVGERVVGADGFCWLTRQEGYIEGKKPYKYTGKVFSGMVAEHAELIKSIQGERPRINDCKRMAESTMTMILGRMAAYSGRQLNWDYAINAKEDLFPTTELEMGPMPMAPLPVPGQTELL